MIKPKKIEEIAGINLSELKQGILIHGNEVIKKIFIADEEHYMTTLKLERLEENELNRIIETNYLIIQKNEKVLGIKRLSWSYGKKGQYTESDLDQKILNEVGLLIA